MLTESQVIAAPVTEENDEFARSHFPCLLNYPDEQSTVDVARIVAMKIDLDRRDSPLRCDNCGLIFVTQSQPP